jgi:hypothetical protein
MTKDSVETGVLCLYTGLIGIGKRLDQMAHLLMHSIWVINIQAII